MRIYRKDIWLTLGWNRIQENSEVLMKAVLKQLRYLVNRKLREDNDFFLTKILMKNRGKKKQLKVFKKTQNHILANQSWWRTLVSFLLIAY